MKHIRNICIYLFVSYFIISCKPSSKINSDEVQDMISKIEECNKNNDFQQSIIYLKYIDSIYKNDVEVKKRYLELLKQTNKFKIEYNLKSFSDSLNLINDSILEFVKKYDIVKIEDKDRNECYYLSDKKSKIKNNTLDFSLRLNEDATFCFLTNMTISNKDLSYNSISLNGKDNIWQSNIVNNDNPNNYTYKFENGYIETVMFNVSDINNLKDVVLKNSELHIKFYGDSNKLLKTKKLNEDEIRGIRNICLMQNLVSKQVYYQYRIDNAKKRLLKLI